MQEMPSIMDMIISQVFAVMRILFGLLADMLLGMLPIALLIMLPIAALMALLMTRRPRVLAGKAFVTDGDGVRVQGREVRFAALDAPEWDQRAQHGDGYWFAHGKRVKSALITKIGGKRVKVRIETWDKYGRAVGTVTCQGRDVGEWLVREGHAIAAYGDRYKAVEREARQARRGMWAHKRNVDPRAWRHAGKKPGSSPTKAPKVPNPPQKASPRRRQPIPPGRQPLS